MIRVMGVAQELGYLTAPEGTIIDIDKIGITRDKHSIEILDSKLEKVYIYILEDEFNKVRVPGTGNLYKILDFTSIDDVENSFKSTFCCVYKEC